MTEYWSAISSLSPAEQQLLERLPPMPEITRRLFALRNDPLASVDDLAELVRLDPGLAAQVLRYARSPLFAYRGRLETVEEAIGRVLGFDTVLNMALGLSIGQGFPLPDPGPLGRLSFWRHSVYAAALSQTLAKAMPSALRPTPGSAYLIGLLHNIGIVALGQLAGEEYRYLNAMMASDPQLEIGDCETGLVDERYTPWLRLGHAELGAEMLAAWGFSAELVTAARQHHNPHYQGEHAVAAHLALLVDRLLSQIGVAADVREQHLPFTSLSLLELSAERVGEVLQTVVDGSWELDSMSHQMAA